MPEITVKIHHRWKDEEQLVKRIARVTQYTDEYVQQKQDGYKWTLNYQSNDWWCSGIEDGHIKIAYRYGAGGNAEMMTALKIFLEWVLNRGDRP